MFTTKLTDQDKQLIMSQQYQKKSIFGINFGKVKSPDKNIYVLKIGMSFMGFGIFHDNSQYFQN